MTSSPRDKHHNGLGTPIAEADTAPPSSDFGSSLRFDIAASDRDKERIYDSRYEIGKDLYPFLFRSNVHGHVARDAFDAHSHLFYAAEGPTVVASCRAAPCIDGQWEISGSLPDSVALDFDAFRTVQVDRVYVDHKYRMHKLHERLFYEFSNWVLANTGFTHYFAVCNAVLVRLYKSLGADLKIPDGFHLTGRMSHSYFLVHGSIEELNANIGKRPLAILR